MRLLILIVGALALAQCATAEDRHFRVGDSEDAYVIIGLAEASDNREARYRMLWRRLDGGGRFAGLSGSNAFEARTNQGSTLRLRGIPGEFTMLRLDPGVYALDSVFGLIHGERVNYVSEGVIQGPERPTFDVRAGEAIYLGLWEADVVDGSAVARPWRVSETDLREVLHNSDEVLGEVRIRETVTRQRTLHAASAEFTNTQTGLLMHDDTLDQLLAGIRRFVNERLIPLEAKVSEEDAVPADALAEMRALGLFGLSIPEEYGGLGLSMEAECRVMFEFCRCSPAFRSAFWHQMSASAARGS